MTFIIIIITITIAIVMIIKIYNEVIIRVKQTKQCRDSKEDIRRNKDKPIKISSHTCAKAIFVFHVFLADTSSIKSTGIPLTIAITKNSQIARHNLPRVRHANYLHRR